MGAGLIGKIETAGREARQFKYDGVKNFWGNKNLEGKTIVLLNVV